MGKLVHTSITEELLETLAMHVLGVLDAEAAADLEEHLAEGCGACEQQLAVLRDTFAVVGATAPLFTPPSHVRDRILAAIEVAGPAEPVTQATVQTWQAWPAADNSDLHVVRSSEDLWEQVIPGVRAKRLYVDPHRDTVTMLIRMDPGASYLPHRHAGPEQCFVLEGDVGDGGFVVRAGDFQCAAEGTVHGAQRTESGCLLLIVSSLRDELLD
jgi:anti-sigma factor ChrR (cupin superfamily)